MRFPAKIRVYGDKSYRGECPKEDAEQVAFFYWLRGELPDLGRIAFHTRNEGLFTHAQIERFKREGLTPGVADIVIPGQQTLAIELKRRDHTLCELTRDQKSWLMNAKSAGWRVCIALGADAAAAAVIDWIEEAL